MEKRVLPFGDWSVEPELFCWIFHHLPMGSTLLELGSGPVSAELSKIYNLYSVENNQHFMDKYRTNYLYAPGNGWYDHAAIKHFIETIPIHYDMILIDGPESGDRPNMLKYLEIFDLSKPIVLDDIQEPYLYQMGVKLSEACGRPHTEYQGREKQFMVIP